MRTNEERTGIFVRLTRKAENWKETVEILRNLSKTTVESLMKQWEDAAFHVLGQNGFNGIQYPYKLPEGASPAARDAVDLIFAIMGTRDFIKQNDARQAAFCAFRAGHIGCRMCTRPHEPAAKAGRNSSEGREKALAARKANAGAEHAAWKEYARALKERYEYEFPSKQVTKRQIADATSKYFGIEFETVRKALRK